MLRAMVMGVSGGGKSSLGRALAARLNAVFIDADDLHSAENIAWMAAGKPLDDAMRWPWLDACGAAMAGHERVILACSALKRSYRDRLRLAVPDLRIVYPELTFEIVAERLAAREGHFMPPSLLKSQFATLEPPSAEESPCLIPGLATVQEGVALAADALADVENPHGPSERDDNAS